MDTLNLDPQRSIFSVAKEKARSQGFKALIIIALVLVFLIPVGFVRSIIYDRQSFKKDAINSILEPMGGELSINGLSLFIEYFAPVEKTERLENGRERVVTQRERFFLAVSPSVYELAAETGTKILTRGIFSIPTYSGLLNMHSRFEIPENLFLEYDGSGRLKNNAFIALELSNNKNIREFPLMTSAESVLGRKINKENLYPYFGNNIQFDVSAFITRGAPLVIDGVLSFQGGNALHLAPLAGDSVFTVRSDWKTPSFSGGWLPAERVVDETGFSASWQIAGISTFVNPVLEFTPQAALAPVSGEQYFETDSYTDKITVQFFTPVENYRKAERSVKYSLLFLLVPFLTIFLFEIFMRIKIHPVQYCLIGLANIIFYLLLLSVSEHMAFNAAYFISAAAVTALVSVYVGSILRRMKWAFVIAAIQAVSYLFLFGTLQAEDYALLIGSLGMFVVVAVLMCITRKIDWYSTEIKR